MGIIHKRRRAVEGRHHLKAKKSRCASGRAGQFLRSAFYYLKAEQLLKTSMRLLCEAA
jgi:hypothetical protein